MGELEGDNVGYEDSMKKVANHNEKVVITERSNLTTYQKAQWCLPSHWHAIRHRVIVMVVIGCIGMSCERGGAASGGHVDLNASHGIGHGRLEVAEEHRSRPYSACF